MKLIVRLMLLMILIMTSLKGFSQSVTDSTSIQLERPIVKLVIKDLITGDGAKEELALNIDKIKILEQKIVLKDSIITNLNKSVMNFESILITKSDQLAMSQELSLKLQTDLKKQKARTKLFQLGSGALVVGGLVLLLAK